MSHATALVPNDLPTIRPMKHADDYSIADVRPRFEPSDTLEGRGHAYGSPDRPLSEIDVQFFQRQVRKSLHYALQAHQHSARAYEAACDARRDKHSNTAEVERLAGEAAARAYEAHIAAQNAHTAYVWTDHGNAERADRHAADACRDAALAADAAEAALHNHEIVYSARRHERPPKV